MGAKTMRTGAECMKRRWPGRPGAWWGLILLAAWLSGCASGGPKANVRDVCEIFSAKPDWYADARAASRRWDISIPILMAIIHQESRFVATARPPRRRCLWVFPGPRPSSAYGYAQAADATWKTYQRSTGRKGADRDDFGDAVDFVGWYCRQSVVRCGISKDNAADLYLAYHEGHGGFNRGTYKKKAWLRKVARRVAQRANSYRKQLSGCEKELRRVGGCCLWPF